MITIGLLLVLIIVVVVVVAVVAMRYDLQFNRTQRSDMFE